MHQKRMYLVKLYSETSVTSVTNIESLKSVRRASKSNLQPVLYKNTPEALKDLFLDKTMDRDKLISLANIINMITIVGWSRGKEDKYTFEAALPNWQQLFNSLKNIGIAANYAYDIINICIHEGSKRNLFKRNYHTSSAQALYDNIKAQINIFDAQNRNKPGEKPNVIISHKDMDEYFKTGKDEKKAITTFIKSFEAPAFQEEISLYKYTTPDNSLNSSVQSL